WTGPALVTGRAGAGLSPEDPPRLPPPPVGWLRSAVGLPRKAEEIHPGGAGIRPCALFALPVSAGGAAVLGAQRAGLSCGAGARAGPHAPALLVGHTLESGLRRSLGGS